MYAYEYEESYFEKCIGLKLIDLKMQLCFYLDDEDPNPAHDGPIQLELIEKSSVLHAAMKVEFIFDVCVKSLKTGFRCEAA